MSPDDPTVPYRRNALNRRRVATLVFAIAAMPGVLIAQPEAAAPNALHGDSMRGKMLYQACEACHSVDQNDIGPRHRGVLGRRAGAVPDYAYSVALKNSDIVWDEALLDRWLSNPSDLVPGTKMFFKLDDAQARADVIAFLKEQK
jgi:cytochrome c